MNKLALSTLAVLVKRRYHIVAGLALLAGLSYLSDYVEYLGSPERAAQVLEERRVEKQTEAQALANSVSKNISSQAEALLKSKAKYEEAILCSKKNEKAYDKCDAEGLRYTLEFKLVGKSKDPEDHSVIPKAQAEEHQDPIGPKIDNPFLSPSELFGPTKKSDKCYVSQTENEHVIQKNGGMFATDIACNFGEGVGKRAEVYAPDLRDKPVMWRVEHVGHDNLLGSFVQLRLAYEKPDGTSDQDESFYLGHTETKFKEGDFVRTGQRIGQMVLNGATTWWHVHVEYRRLGVDGKTWKSERYFTGARESALDNKRKGNLPTGYKWGDSFHFTGYDLGDPNQNDASPCHWADGTNMCDNAKRGEKQIALTVDVRNALGVKFGDKVKLVGKCTGEYVVRDEMNSRFRYACIRNESSGLCIKGDIALFEGKGHECSGPYKILQA